MMNRQEEIKEALHQYIEQADERMLAILQAVMEADLREAQADLEQAFQLAETRREQVADKSMPVSSWQEAKKRV